MPPSILYESVQTHPTYSVRDRNHYHFLVHFSGPILGTTIYIAPIELSIPDHEPSAYFDVATFTTNTYRKTIIVIIAINMAAPTPEQFMAGVNTTGSDGRRLPAGAAASMTAAEQEARRKADEQEARRKADEQTSTTASAASREVARENEKSAEKETSGEEKSLLRRVGGKIASVFKRE